MLGKICVSLQANLENTSERLIKAIAELRRRIHNAKDKLDKEIHVSRILQIYNLIHIQVDNLFFRLA